MLKSISLSFCICTIVLLLFSCNNHAKKVKNEGIPLESIDKKLIYRSENLAEGILNSFDDKNGVDYLFRINNITPILTAGIKRYKIIFEESYSRLNSILGDLTSPELIKVVQKPYLKSFRYKLTSSNEDITISSVTLILDINVDYNLANFYLMVTSKNGKLINQSVLPEVYIQF
ncbi:hypothetical protein JBL43_11100 [Aureibaculum sp. A20]|uniref:DUF4252 domain-containing protein n=1 Tax=Aureibaculum flavum TaxID=2795986 RepID=A0ABS0WS53_9FLAO|nr:hypothetical protein [Aureibaculum flavum]MBJ2174787.1 hypothetical protein [Aureibaculum flavum]